MPPKGTKNSVSNSGSSLSHIRSRLPELITSEMKVAEWVLQNPQETIHMTMAKVAEECGVSNTTVLRFCRSCGFYGFTDLKLSLAMDLAKPTQMIHDTVDENDDIPTIARKVSFSNIQAIQDTFEVMDFDSLARIIDMLWAANLIYIYGVGTSAPIATDMYNKLFRLGLNCKTQPDPYLQLMEVTLAGPGDVVVEISQSGSSIDPVLVLETAQKNGAGTICITGNAQSPLTQFADEVLLSVSTETRQETIASRIAQNSIVDVIYIILSMQDVEKTLDNEKRIWRSIRAKTI